MLLTTELTITDSNDWSGEESLKLGKYEGESYQPLAQIEVSTTSPFRLTVAELRELARFASALADNLEGS